MEGSRPDWSETDAESALDPPPPATAPAGDLALPPRKPPTAIATFASNPAPRPPRPVRSRNAGARPPGLGSQLVAGVNAALDVLDAIGDAVRAAAERAAR